MRKLRLEDFWFTFHERFKQSQVVILDWIVTGEVIREDFEKKMVPSLL